ncbi:phosphoribosylglycinamide formyltransferase [Croceiramulus getboli]|nr:phosphoribosylglycinamide formyltransferase [Flavobacteriaceae bacterium YJPT1-3]
MKKIVIFASGNGTNAQRIIDYFQGHAHARVVLVLSNNKNAKVLDRATQAGVSAMSFNRDALYKDGFVLTLLQGVQPDLIVLAGFLWLFPTSILQAFPKITLNIHPALLPEFGGKGMYGRHVHEAVIASAKKESGITIHQVSENYDEGEILFQARVPVDPQDSPESLAQKIHELEYEHYPRVIESFLFRES